MKNEKIIRPSKVFLRYAAAFEEAYVDDSWERLHQFLAEPIVYTVEGAGLFSGTYKGRAAMLQGIRHSLDEFDRRFEKRIPSFERPQNDGAQVTVTWKVLYQHPAVEDCLLNGKTIAHTEQGKIIRMTDFMNPAECLAASQVVARL